MIGFSTSGTASVYLSEIFFSNDGVTPITGIEDIVKMNEPKTNRFYNLNGQRVNGLQRGINIVDGQKIMVK